MTKGAKMATYRISAENTLIYVSTIEKAESIRELMAKVEALIVENKRPMFFVNENGATIIPPDLLQNSIITIKNIEE